MQGLTLIMQQIPQASSFTGSFLSQALSTRPDQAPSAPPRPYTHNPGFPTRAWGNHHYRGCLYLPACTKDMHQHQPAKMERGRQGRWPGGALWGPWLKPWSRAAILRGRHLPGHARPSDRKILQKVGFARPPCPYTLYHVSEDGSSHSLVQSSSGGLVFKMHFCCWQPT